MFDFFAIIGGGVIWESMILAHHICSHIINMKVYFNDIKVNSLN